MSDPTVMTTLTIPDAPKPSLMSKLGSKMSQLLWLLIVVIIIAVVFLFMWRRGDREALKLLARRQMKFVQIDDCTALISESIRTYHDSQAAVRPPSSPLDKVPNQQPFEQTLGEEEEDEEDGEDEEDFDELDEDELSVMTEEEDDEDDDAPPPPPVPED